MVYTWFTSAHHQVHWNGCGLYAFNSMVSGLMYMSSHDMLAVNWHNVPGSSNI